MRNTKERIADTALRLFNEAGTDSVSTNHIAAAMNISPGNLYYHFSNKDEIVLVLLDRLAAGLETTWVKSNGSSGLESLRPVVATCYSLLDQYRFYAREVYALAHRSPVLRERSKTLTERGTWVIEQLMVANLDTRFWGQPPDRTVYRWLASAVWLGLMAYVASTEVRAELQDPDVGSDGVDFVLGLVEPYLQAETRSSGTYLKQVAHA